MYHEHYFLILILLLHASFFKPYMEQYSFDLNDEYIIGHIKITIIMCFHIIYSHSYAPSRHLVTLVLFV